MDLSFLNCMIFNIMITDPYIHSYCSGISREFRVVRDNRVNQIYREVKPPSLQHSTSTIEQSTVSTSEKGYALIFKLSGFGRLSWLCFIFKICRCQHMHTHPFYDLIIIFGLHSSVQRWKKVCIPKLWKHFPVIEEIYVIDVIM